MFVKFEPFWGLKKCCDYSDIGFDCRLTVGSPSGMDRFLYGICSNYFFEDAG